ncbi:hypothetical protein Desmer_2517 [Desulfosporosinus meridiei DSM 13257]|uniref:Uncharacterized protein n=1 Tax=Desulfosporosinus meridiei (strain ATCC BAA-275 / DSM 13257 / KCTC 12902 / NCIMB 13706 / S10) TaxID=768704 RepID=J7IWA8_DESMD|nr:hypothetical protein Desmer_2517 [Desulfosporosinus meridiei DSM 13257]
MILLLGFLRSVLFICVILYIYYITRRKKNDVVIQMWLTVIVGMLSSLAIQIVNVVMGNAIFESVLLSISFLVALIAYSIWKVTREFKKRRYSK